VKGISTIIRGIDEIPKGAMGPIWVGKIVEPEFLRRLRPLNEDVKKLFEKLEEEADGPPFYQRLDLICSKLNVRIPKPKIVIESLKELGHFAARSHLDPLGIKTTAKREEIEDLVRKLTSS